MGQDRQRAAASAVIDSCHMGDVRDGLRVTEAELAYCAGVIDSDGTIGVKHST